jgi:glycine cleavage system H protein
MVFAIVLLTFAVFIAADIAAQAREARKARTMPAPAGQIPLPWVDVLEPAGAFVDLGHTWVGLEPSGAARIGMDDFASRAMGRLDAVGLPRPGQEVHRGDRLFTVRQGDRSAAFVAPLDGVVLSVNEGLKERAEDCASDAYGKGWICTLRPTNLARNLRGLLIADEAKDWLRRELGRLQAFLAARQGHALALGEVSPDGGQLATHPLSRADAESWRLFEQEFLSRTEPDPNA